MSGNSSCGKILCRPLGAVAFVALLTGPVAANSNHTCTVGFVPNWGEQVRYEDGKPTGPLVDASGEILNRAGIAFTFPPVASTSRLVRDFAEGKVDILVAMDGMVPVDASDIQSEAFLEEYLVTIMAEGKRGTGTVAVSPTVSHLLAATHSVTPPHELMVESLPRRARLLADGNAVAVRDALSNMLGLQFHVGADSHLVIDRLLSTVPIRFFFNHFTQCDYQIGDINLSIDTWHFEGGMVRLRNASWAKAIKGENH